MERACKSCLDLISQKKTHSTFINMLKKPGNENYQTIPYYEGEHQPKQNNMVFETAREILMNEGFEMLVKRRFGRVYIMMECKSYMKKEDVPENKENFIHGFEHIKTDKIDIYTSIGCKSDERYENDKLFKFWSKKSIYEKIEMRMFKITGWSFLTLVKRNNFFKSQSIVCS